MQQLLVLVTVPSSFFRSFPIKPCHLSVEQCVSLPNDGVDLCSTIDGVLEEAVCEPSWFGGADGADRKTPGMKREAACTPSSGVCETGPGRRVPGTKWSDIDIDEAPDLDIWRFGIPVETMQWLQEGVRQPRSTATTTRNRKVLFHTVNCQHIVCPLCLCSHWNCHACRYFLLKLCGHASGAG